MLGRLQCWLHGCPSGSRPYTERPWAMAWLGNRVSDLRYYLWRASGGRDDEFTMTDEELEAWFDELEEPEPQAHLLRE